MRPNTCWAYLAVSTEQQSETLIDQEAWANALAAEKGWHIDRVFSGVSSGRAGPRRTLRELISALRAIPEAGRPEWIVLLRADRFGRGRIAESQIAQHELIDLGVRIWTRNEGEVKLDSAMDQLIAAVRATTAAFENEVRSEKMLAAHRRRRERGLPAGTKRPYGLTAGPDGKDVAVDDAAAVVRQIFALRTDGLGYLAIARAVAPSAPPWRYTNGDVRPMRWVPRRVRAVLNNHAYVGPVIDELTWHRAQAVSSSLGRARPASVNPWPLSGALRCYCGYAVHGRASGRAANTRYYACTARWNHDNRIRYIPAVAIELQFVELLADLKKFPHKVAEHHAAATNAPSPALLDRAIEEARGKVDAANHQRTRVWQLHADRKIRDEDLQERLDAFREVRDEELGRIAELEAQRAIAAAATRRVTDTEALIAKAARLYARATVEQQRALAKAVALDLGGLCVEEDRSLSVRTPAGAGKLERRQRTM